MASFKWLLWGKWAQKFAESQRRGNLKTLLQSGDVTQRITAGLSLARSREGVKDLISIAEAEYVPIVNRTEAINGLAFANDLHACAALDAWGHHRQEAISSAAIHTYGRRAEMRRPRRCAFCDGKPLRYECWSCKCQFCESCIGLFLAEATILLERVTGREEASLADIAKAYESGDAFCLCCYRRRVDRWSSTDESLRTDWDLGPTCSRI